MNTPTPETDALKAKYQTDDRTETEWLEFLWGKLREMERQRDANLELLAKTKRQLRLALDGFVKLQNERNPI